jgi:hypothetical protein
MMHGQRNIKTTGMSHLKIVLPIIGMNFWHVLWQYGIAEVAGDYREYKCQVIHERNLTEAFRVHSGVQQGCILSPTLFLIVMGDIMRRVTQNKRMDIRWGLHGKSEDLDYTDDVCLLLQRY